MTGENNGFSVLVAVYDGEESKYFRSSLLSAINQTHVPPEIVVVKDGPLTPELNSVLSQFKEKYNGVLKIVKLSTNRGAGKAYQIGVENCSYEYVAQLNADDIALENRFEKQMHYFKANPGIDVVGTYVGEYTNDVNKIQSIRKVPADSETIRSWAKFRSPVNNPSVMFKKQSVLEVGNYRDIRRAQDYDLWARMIMDGYKIENIPEVLTLMHVDDDFYARKGGISSIKNEVRIHRNLYKTGLINKPELVANLLVKIPIKAAPVKIKKIVYNRFLRE